MHCAIRKAQEYLERAEYERPKPHTELILKCGQQSMHLKVLQVHNKNNNIHICYAVSL